jgi:hypothetical protein
MRNAVARGSPAARASAETLGAPSAAAARRSAIAFFTERFRLASEALDDGIEGDTWRRPGDARTGARMSPTRYKSAARRLAGVPT